MCLFTINEHLILYIYNFFFLRTDISVFIKYDPITIKIPPEQYDFALSIQCNHNTACSALLSPCIFVINLLSVFFCPLKLSLLKLPNNPITLKISHGPTVFILISYYHLHF